MSAEQLRSKLEPFGQADVLQFWEELNSAERENLARQIDELDLAGLAELVAGKEEAIDFAAMAAAATSPPAVGVDGSGVDWSIDEAKLRGEAALEAGEIGAVLVAGGQGTRLGFDQPKGMFPIGPVSGRTLFQFFADRLDAISKRYGRPVPLYLMTSDATDAETRKYFDENENLGLPSDVVRIFRQGTMPAVDADSGKLLLSSPSSLALSPDGHGGTVAALDRSGCLDDAEARGIRHLSYIQVDNPIAALCDPVLLGHHLLAESEMTTQVIRKRYPMEKVGNVVGLNGRVQIIEYSDLPAAAAEATMAGGSLRLWAGNIAVHVFDLAFLRRMSGSAGQLPFHRAHKKVAYVGQDGQLVEPTEPNATKFERFIFDLLPAARNAIVVECRPTEAFAPVKNKDGSPADTPELARRAISELHAGWLTQAGAVVDEGVSVEINPRFSLDLDGLSEKIPAKMRIESDRYFDR